MSSGAPSSTPALGYVILYVESLDRAISFYCEALGFQLKFRQGPYGELVTGATTLALSERAFVREHIFGGVELPLAGQGCSEIGVLVPEAEVDGLYRRAVQAGAQAVVEPVAQPWGQRISYVRDLDGHLVEICSPVSRVSR